VNPPTAAPGGDGEAPAVIVDGVSKRFRVPHERTHTLKERVLHPLRRSAADEFEALKDISFEVQPGEFFGIVGRNGSGKSTLLKCLAGIYRADEGSMYLSGRLSTFIELGVGFNPDLAARDNVILNATMLGLSPAEARRRFEQVIEFAELEEFVDLKLKNYSSGMHVRLAFSVMIQVDADVLLIDEVLAVGDASFQRKCFDVFHRLREQGKTILFVTHDMGAVKQFCHRALLLERGEVRIIGEPERVGNHYMELNFGRDRTAEGQAAQDAGEAAEPVEERFGDQSAEIIDAWFADGDGRPTDHIAQGDPCHVRVRVRFHEAAERPTVSFVLENEQRLPLFATSTYDAGIATGSHRPGDVAVFTVSLPCQFGPGRLYLSPWVTHRRELLDRRPRMATAVVTAINDSGALVNLPHEARYEREGALMPSPEPAP
jgi:ABC-type polysaccharide/polyol phosphate transport system ATPase subunit